LQDKAYRAGSFALTAEIRRPLRIMADPDRGVAAMSERNAAGADYLSTCYREVACALREVIPTLRHIRSREELESVAVCYEKLAEHRDSACLLDESVAETPGR
jgi:hypothetical protein